MDTRRQIIDYIERCYQSYLERQSDVLFNAATNELFDLVFNIPVCKDIIANIKELKPISYDSLKCNQETEYFNYIDNITQGTEYYVSYCLHWFDYIKAKGIYTNQKHFSVSFGNYGKTCFDLINFKLIKFASNL